MYAKATYTINDQWAAGVQEWYSPSVSNTGASGWYTVGNVTFTAPSTWFPANRASAAIFPPTLATGLSAPATPSTAPVALGAAPPGHPGVKYTSYWNWDAGFGFTYKAFTLDLRYYDTNLTKSQCNAFTSASELVVLAEQCHGAKSGWSRLQLVQRGLYRQALLRDQPRGLK